MAIMTECDLVTVVTPSLGEEEDAELSKIRRSACGMNKIANIAPEKRQRGRPPGSRNKVPALLKDAILLAAEEVGEVEEQTTEAENGRIYTRRFATRKGGLLGYLQGLAINQPVAFAGLLGKVLPLQVASETDSELIIRWLPPSEPPRR
jgi:hypothetical protein